LQRELNRKGEFLGLSTTAEVILAIGVLVAIIAFAIWQSGGLDWFKGFLFGG